MAIDKHLKNGESFIQKGDLDSALKELDLALRENPLSFKGNFQKSIALQRNKQYDEALRYLKRAENSAKSRGSKESLTSVLFRYFTLFMNTKNYENAVKFLNSAEKQGHNPTEITLWKSQLNSKLKKEDPAGEIDLASHWEDIYNLPNFVSEVESIKSAPTIKSTAQLDVKTELERKPANENKDLTAPKEIKIDFFQSNSAVSVSVFIKNLPQDSSLKVVFRKESVEITYPTLNSSEFQYIIGPLFSYIVPSESKYKIFSTKLELVLVKQDQIKWKSLERSESSEAASASHTVVPPSSSNSNFQLSYPSSSKKNVDWSKLSIKEEEDDDESTGNENEFFQKLYRDADEDTRRAMMKSFVESNGTALSTNWEDVSKKKFETSPPDGLEAKKW